MLLSSCQYPWGDEPSEIDRETLGKYEFKYPSGEFEIIKLNRDQTYSQYFYENNDAYQFNKPKYSNDATWFSGGNKIIFSHWQEYCYLFYPDSILPEPEFSEELEVFWYAKTDKVPAKIEVWMDSHYIFIKKD